ncbi:MAG: ATP-binding cassette domain-containing protein [Firmicutes bacterium]|nr:ATP-binding cassette domain-containing protein [Bacillota bacterium]
MDKPIIKLDKVSKDFLLYKTNMRRFAGLVFGLGNPSRKHALKDVSMEVKKGEKILVLGGAEAGCTTLLRVICGLSNPTSGTVNVNGSIMELIAPNAGLDVEQNAEENIYLKANVFGIKRDIIKEHFDEIVEFAGLKKFLRVPLKQAPKGLANKMALIMYFLQEKDIMLIDLNFSTGTLESRDQCRDLIKQQVEARPDATMIITSNQQFTFAGSMCDRAIVLEKGKVVFEGSVEESIAEFTEKCK